MIGDFEIYFWTLCYLHPAFKILLGSTRWKQGGNKTKQTALSDDLHITIRSGTIDDAAKFNKIEKACFPPEMRYGVSILSMLLSMTPIYTILTVELTKNSEIIAFAIGEQDEKNASLGRIITIQVDPSFQRKKVGKKLLLELETKLSSQYGIDYFELQVHNKNQGAIEFYQRQGYKINKLLHNYYARKEHAYLMEKEFLNNP